VKGEGNQQDYGMRIYDPRLGKFLSVDPIANKYPELTPYQFASNRPIDGIDLDGLEFFKKDNFNYRMDYYPVVNSGSIMQGVKNSANNVGAFLWNGTFGALGEGGKGINNYFAGGYKEPSTNIMASFDQFQNQAYKYHTKTPIKEQLQDFGDAATDLKNYELPAQILVAHQFSNPFATVDASISKPLYNGGKMAAMDDAIIESLKPGKPSYRVVSSMEGGGKLTRGLNGGHFPSNVASGLGLPEATLEKWSLFQCAEPKALNKIMNFGVKKSDVSVSTFGIKGGTTYTGNGFNFTSGKTVAPKAACLNCNQTLKGLKNRE